MYVVLTVLACAEVSPPPASALPTVEVTHTVGLPWRVVEEREGRLGVQLGDSAHGVQIVWLSDSRGRVPGVTPVVAGRALEIEGVRRWPLWTLADPQDPVRAVEVTTEGMDLVVRLASVPIRDKSTHPDTPEDPVRLRVRVRPRGETWRVVADGLATLHLPDAATLEPAAATGSRVPWTTALAPPPGPDVAEGSFALSWQGSWGRLEGAVGGPRHRVAETDGHWTLDLSPSLDAFQPYPEVGLTFTPAQPFTAPAVSPSTK